MDPADDFAHMPRRAGNEEGGGDTRPQAIPGHELVMRREAVLVLSVPSHFRSPNPAVVRVKGASKRRRNRVKK